MPLAQSVVLHAAASVRFISILLGLFLTYGVALRAVAGRRSNGLAITAMVAGASFLLLMLLSPALLSSDIFSYIFYGRIAGIYGDDPYTEVPASYPNDPYLRYVFWARDPTYYGPIWTLVSRALAVLGGDYVGLTTLLFRLLAIASVIVTSGLIWWSLAKTRPERAIQGLVFFLWNPLIVIEFGLSAHNDSLMLVFVLLAVALHISRRYAIATTMLVLSMLVKVVAAPLIPLYVVMALRQIPGIWPKARYLLVSGLLVVSVASLTLAAARVGPEVLTVGSLGVSANRYENSLHELAFDWLRGDLGKESEWNDVPVSFEPHWLGAHADAELWSDTEPIGMVRQWNTLLALAPQKGDWIRVFEYATGRVGYVRATSLGPVGRPGDVTGAEITRLEAGPAGSASTREANTRVRIVSWVGFGLVGLVAAWRVRDLRSFLIWSTGVMLAYYWLAAAWIWPWYVTWAFVLAALVPNTRIAGLAAILSAAVLTLYASLGFEGTVDDWIFVYRALPAFALPLVAWVLWLGLRRMLPQGVR